LKSDNLARTGASEYDYRFKPKRGGLEIFLLILIGRKIRQALLPPKGRDDSNGPSVGKGRGQKKKHGGFLLKDYYESCVIGPFYPGGWAGHAHSS